LDGIDIASSCPSRPTASIAGVLKPTRPLPSVGAQARICHFGGGREQGTVIAVSEEGRRLRVGDESGDILEFVLNPATARFLEAGVAQGARLELLGGD
jgi:hypothetical protein